MPTANKHFPSYEVICGLPRLEYYRQYNANRKDKKLAWNHANVEKIRSQRRASYNRHKEAIGTKKKEQYLTNGDAIRERQRIRNANRTIAKYESDCEYQRQYRRDNLAALSEKQRIRFQERFDLQILRTLRSRVSSAIKRTKKKMVFVKKCAPTKELIGCSINEFIGHIESLWLPGMSWGNHGFYGWHIDHILPCASFDLADPAQQRACFHYTNLQPLWWLDNIRKGKKLPGESK